MYLYLLVTFVVDYKPFPYQSSMYRFQINLRVMLQEKEKLLSNVVDLIRKNGMIHVTKESDNNNSSSSMIHQRMAEFTICLTYISSVLMNHNLVNMKYMYVHLICVKISNNM